MERRRVAGYITKQHTNDFEVPVKVEDQVRTPNTNPGLFPSGEPIPEGQTGLTTPDGPFTRKHREVIPPGRIGSQESEDYDRLGLRQYIDTVPYERGEQNNISLHNPLDVQKAANPNEPGIPFQEYASFQPRSAPMPRAMQDEGFLDRYADPIMTDLDSSTIILPRDANRIDLAGPNRDGEAATVAGKK
jgi:hypothetical protein